MTNSNPTQTISGLDVMSEYFQLNNVNSWGMFGVMLLYIALLRAIQYYLFARQTDSLPTFLSGFKCQFQWPWQCGRSDGNNNNKQKQQATVSSFAAVSSFQVVPSESTAEIEIPNV